MDLRKAIEKLNTLDAKDLKGLDLSKFKDYNFARFKDDMASKPNLIIKCILGILTFFAVVYAFSHYQAISGQVRIKETEIQSRLDMIQERDKAESTYKIFLSKFPEAIPVNQLIGKISDFAEEAHVNIVSFSPVKTSDGEHTTHYLINLDVEAKTYQDLVDFLHVVENAPYTLRINKWTGRAMRGSGAYHGEKDIPVGAFIEIESVQLKDA